MFAQTTRSQPIHDAALNGGIKELHAQLSRGVDVNTLGNDGETALMIAVYLNKTESVKFLLEHKANPDIAHGVHGRTGLQSAFFSHRLTLV